VRAVKVSRTLLGRLGMTACSIAPPAVIQAAAISGFNHALSDHVKAPMNQALSRGVVTSLKSDRPVVCPG
jgi:hypothetical protein